MYDREILAALIFIIIYMWSRDDPDGYVNFVNNLASIIIWGILIFFFIVVLAIAYAWISSFTIKEVVQNIVHGLLFVFVIGVFLGPWFILFRTGLERGYIKGIFAIILACLINVLAAKLIIVYGQ